MKPKTTWGARIPGGLAPEAWSFLHSLPQDRYLFEDDVLGTMAHVHALLNAGIIKSTEARKLLQTLKSATAEMLSDGDEDVHSGIERILIEKLGDLGGRVHTGRSRNDQVATAMRLNMRKKITEVQTSVLELTTALRDVASEHIETLAPGYTHMQRAQPITIGHWALAHGWAFLRDAQRLVHAYKECDVCPLGAGALAGTTLRIDPSIAQQKLGFAKTFRNTLDAVSDRDFLVQATSTCALAAVHLSRLAEEIVIWSTSEFGFITLPDAYATGSSMMPNKRNPDVAELARSIPGHATGALTALLMTLKGLPLAYDRDLQSDKNHIQGVFELAIAGTKAMAGLVRNMRFNEKALRIAASDQTLLATDLAEDLVTRGVPFRKAHHTVASSVAESEKSKSTLAEVLPEMAHILLDPVKALERRKTPGGPSKASLRAQIADQCRQSRRLEEENDRAQSRFPTAAALVTLKT